MRRTLFFLFSLFLVSSLSINAQMTLKMLSDISIISPNKLEASESETDLNSDLPAGLPGDVTKLIPGSFMIGLLADVSFPFGEEFKKYAGTGFSGHVFAGYSLLNTLLLTVKVGYIKFGEQDVDLGLAKTTQEGYSVTQTNSQIPILIGGQFIIDPSCIGCFTGSLIQPWIGCQFGVFFKNYSQVSNYPDYGYNGTLEKSVQFTDTIEESNTIFGVVPTVGTYYGISENVKLNITLEYSYLFEEAAEGASNINFLSINAGAVYTFK